MSNIPIDRNNETVGVVLEDVGQAGIKALIYLLKVTESNKYQMVQKSSMGTGSTEGVLLRLYRLGLIQDRPGKGTETIYSLTEKGKKIAEHLDAAERILSEGA